MERIWIFMKITEDIIYAGVNDHQVDLFEGQYKVPNGMAYNSYVILDEKTAVMDTVDANFADEWLANVAKALDGRKPDYLIVQHMEPDHSANIENFVKAYPEATVVANTKTFAMMKNFFPKMDLAGKKLEVKDGESLTLGKHVLTFVFAPMVHWPEVMVTYDSTDKVLFAADGFGKFGALDREEPWDDEARRYFIGIVGKYGLQVQKLLKVAGTLDIQKICSLHGPVLTENLGHYIEKYDIWSSYRPEEEGVVVAYTSVYGNTKKAAELLADKLKEKGCPNVVVYDLARDDMSAAVADAFRYSKLVLATLTYNAGIYPFMQDFINRLTERSFQNRTIGLIENGSWAPTAAKVMKGMFEKSKNITWTENNVKVMSAVKEENVKEIEALGGKAEALQCNVSDYDKAAEMMAYVVKTYGRVDILVNNAGITRDNLLMKMSEEDFDAVLNTNLKGAFNCIKHISRQMLKQKSGHIVNISSVSGVMGNAGQVNYSASKAGVIGMTKAVAREMASRGITCNAVAPGFIKTDMTEVLSDTIKENISAQIPMRAFGETADVANLVAFLASDEAKYITGQVICVDGGMAM